MWKFHIVFWILLGISQFTSAQFNNHLLKHTEILQNIQQMLKERRLSSPDEFPLYLEDGSPELKPTSVFTNGTVDPSVILSSLAKFLIPTASLNPEISLKCRENSWLYAESLANFTVWALNMFDATGKMPDGIARGNFHAMGHFDQCLQVKGPQVNSDPSFTGKYCTVFLSPQEVPENQSKEPDTKSLFGLLRFLSLFGRSTDPVFSNHTKPGTASLPSLAFCLPSTCSAKDIGLAVADSIGTHIFGQKQIVPIATEDYCTVADTVRQFDAATITFIVVLSIVAFFLVLGTIYDTFLQWKETSKKDLRLCNRLLLSFSILSNGTQVFDTNGSAEGVLSCLNGIRFFSMTWVVMYHSWKQNMSSPDANLAQLQQDGLSWSLQTIENSLISVDSFFFLSGLLVAYVELGKMDKSQGRLNVPLMYLHRYLRLTPVYAFIIGFLSTLFVYLGTGPYWGTAIALSNACRESWWKHVLYINNFFPDTQENTLCMRLSWYLATDMQMYLVAPLFIYILWRWPKPGLAFLGVATLGFIAGIMAIVSIEDLPPTIILSRTDSPDGNQRYYNDCYRAPWCRIPPFLVGIFMGFVFYKTKKQEIKMKPWMVIIGWSVATAIALSVVYGLNGYLDQTAAPVIPEVVSVLYASLHRTAWAVSLSWLVFACVHGYGGFINRFLSWPAFLPLSRLSYTTYLIHHSWIDFYYARTRTAFYYTTVDAVSQFFMTLVISMGLAFIATVCFEIPFLNLERLIFPTKRYPPIKEHLEVFKVTLEGQVNGGFESAENQRC